MTVPYGILAISDAFRATVQSICVGQHGHLESGYRTPEANDALKPASTDGSMHQLGLAEDWFFQTDADMKDAASGLEFAGFQVIRKTLALHVEFDAKWWLSKHRASLYKEV